MWFALARSIASPLARLIFFPKVIGRKNIPKKGRVLLASNHLAFVDSIVITLVAPRRVAFMAKDEYFTTPGFKGWCMRMFFTAIGAVSVKRGAGAAAQAALDKGLDILEGDGAYAVYPEGTRSLDGRLYRGRTGVAWLALQSSAPVVPVALKDTPKLLPKGAKLPRLHRITVQFGEVIEPQPDVNAKSARARRELTDTIMDAIHEMSGQELAGRYNSPGGKSPLMDKVRDKFRQFTDRTHPTAPDDSTDE